MPDRISRNTNGSRVNSPVVPAAKPNAPSKAEAAPAPVRWGSTAPKANDSFKTGGPATRPLTLLGDAPRAASPAPSKGPFQQVVVNGDTLTGTAQRYNLPLSDLIAQNPEITDPNVLLAGQNVRIPGWTSRTVVSGDTLWGISRDAKTDVNTLATANKMATPNDLIRPGDVLAIPDVERAPGVVEANWGAQLGLGALKGSTSTGEATVFQFENGSLTLSKPSNEILQLEARGATVPGTVVMRALVEQKGPFLSASSGELGGQTFEFGRGQITTVNAQIVASSGDVGAMGPAEYAKELGLGAQTGSYTADGVEYLHYEKGSLAVNDEGRVSMVLSDAFGVPANVLDQMMERDLGPFTGSFPQDDGTTSYAFERGVVAHAGSESDSEITSATMPEELKNLSAIVDGGPALAKGARGAGVKEAQTLLNSLGHTTGVADGIFGPKTEAGVRGFQEAVGLPVTGQLDAITVTAMAIMLRPGC
jgi:LysM repeat protein